MLCGAKEARHTNEYLLIYSIYIKLRNRPNKAMVMAVGILATLGLAGRKHGGRGCWSLTRKKAQGKLKRSKCKGTWVAQ